MAFAPIIVLILIIIEVILALTFAAGVALLVTGLCTRGRKAKRAENADDNGKGKGKVKKAPIVMIIVGCLLMVPAVAIFVPLFVYTTKTDIERAMWKDADNVADLWKHVTYTDETAAPVAIAMLLEDADAGDRQAFAENFAESVRADKDFEEKLDKFFAEYPGGLKNLNYKGGVSSSDGDSNRGVVEKHATAYYDVVVGDESYYLNVSYCYWNDAHPEGVGITRFQIMNLGGYVEYNYYGTGYRRGYDEGAYLICNMATPEEVSARRVAGEAIPWAESDVAPISEYEMEKILRASDTIRDAQATGKLGTPNAQITDSLSSAVEYYYELLPQPGGPRFAQITTDDEGKILYAYIRSDEKSDYNNKVK